MNLDVLYRLFDTFSRLCAVWARTNVEREALPQGSCGPQQVQSKEVSGEASLRQPRFPHR